MTPTVVLYTFASKATDKPLTRYRFDVTNFRDPIGNDHLRGLYTDGRAGEVRQWIAADPKVASVLTTVEQLVAMHLKHEANMTIGFHDHHGIWIAPAIAEMARDRIVNIGFAVSLTHHAIPKTPLRVG